MKPSLLKHPSPSITVSRYLHQTQCEHETTLCCELFTVSYCFSIICVSLTCDSAGAGEGDGGRRHRADEEKPKRMRWGQISQSVQDAEDFNTPVFVSSFYLYDSFRWSNFFIKDVRLNLPLPLCCTFSLVSRH